MVSLTLKRFKAAASLVIRLSEPLGAKGVLPI